MRLIRAARTRCCCYYPRSETDKTTKEMFFTFKLVLPSSLPSFLPFFLAPRMHLAFAAAMVL